MSLLQRKGFYKASHNTTGDEGLINSTNVREREALRVDPCLSLMPYVSSEFDTFFFFRKKRCGADGTTAHVSSMCDLTLWAEVGRANKECHPTFPLFDTLAAESWLVLMYSPPV